MDKDFAQAYPDLGAATDAPLSDSLLRSAVPYWLLTLLVLLLAAALYLLSRFNYLFFHFLVETFFIVVSFTVFSIGWNARKFVQNNSLMMLAAGFVVIGNIEVLHLVSYKGMGVFPEINANMATQFWIAARYLEAATYLAAAVLWGVPKRISHWTLLGGSVLIGILAVGAIWPLAIFPDCYIEGEGLTRFKIVSEHIISLMFGLAILIFWRYRKWLDRRILKLLTAAISLSIIAELAFTLYVDVYGVANFLGHFTKFMSVVLVYRALVIGTLRSPYATLFRDLSQTMAALDLELGQRRKTEAELLAANRELDAFVRTVSHDLRSPLTPIIGLPELMLEQMRDKLDADAKKSLQDIREQGLRMARILEDLLLFARAGRLIEGVGSARVDDVVQNVLEDLGSRIIDSGAVIEVHDLPNVSLPRTALFQVFSNLISNAIKYAGSDGSPIEIGGRREDDSVLLYVRDHGPGIPEDIREQIFEVFDRGRMSEEETGSGVGLATVLKIARCLNGHAWVEETEGGGATFRVRLKEPEPDRQQSLDFDTSACG